MNLSIDLYSAVIAISIFMLLRNKLVFKAQMRRIEEISAASKRDIARHEYGRLDQRWADFRATTYDAMLFDLRRWTYRQFYPEDVQ
jgi:hypothetical protein